MQACPGTVLLLLNAPELAAPYAALTACFSALLSRAARPRPCYHPPLPLCHPPSILPATSLSVTLLHPSVHPPLTSQALSPSSFTSPACTLISLSMKSWACEVVHE
jgi:hypothetical protein